MYTFGISLYLGTGYEKNKEIIEKSNKNNAKYAFTSLHIPEEKVNNYEEEVKSLLNLCKLNNLNLIVDVGPRTLEKLGFSNFKELKQTSITHLRLDYGFKNQEIIELSKDFNIVFNASTLSDKDINDLKALNADFSRFLACHNFYPKPLTGLSLKKVSKINEKLKSFGITTMAFVAGNKDLRGPLHMGLPTVEEHRCGDLLFNMLQLIKDTETDIPMIGDIDIKDETWIKLKELSEGYISLPATIDEKYSFVKNIIHHDRLDSSDYVIRSQESREYSSQGEIIQAELLKERNKGSVFIGNLDYLRYSGELEIARQDLALEPKVNVIGKINNDGIKYLDYITEGLGFKFI
ncbi:MupG family TIM beta-alpha barrel fold protein [Clostridium sp. C2-6-12]|uniref:MupG family TIM beta-alpha barrel fold protein n=1 Tax=Clostridium sp. C2-6-12 TaxID=2698832 RepID=UPI00136AB496|nr:MupG family TIM beta-alpha barrel fold protein [Clostridium sp. C2-6-12]